MSDKPEKCQYCGGTTHVYRQKYHPTRVISTRFEGQFTQALPTETIGFAVECDTCGAVGPFGKTRKEAIALFNSRMQPEEETAPLTLEELRGMSDTDWVWVVFPELPRCEDGWFRARQLYDTYSKAHYSKTWLAYRRPPEE